VKYQVICYPKRRGIKLPSSVVVKQKGTHRTSPIKAISFELVAQLGFGEQVCKWILPRLSKGKDPGNGRYPPQYSCVGGRGMISRYGSNE